ncbi:MAG TPA: DUF3558 family protein [Acidothermaceae bacterium]
MWRGVTPVVGLVGVAMAVSACAGSTKTVPATVTVTATVTETATAPASAPSASAAPGSAASSEVASLPPVIDPCALLTQAEASTLAGVKLNAAVSAGAAGTKTLCQYTSDPSGPTAQVEIIVGDGAKKELDIDRDTLGHTFTSVPGIGDEADQEDGNIFIRKGDNWVDINLVKLNDPAQNAQPMQTAAKIVASRLP